MDHVTEQAVEQSSTRLLPAGSVLVVVRSGILARTVPIGIAAVPLTVNQDLKALCPKPAIDSEYLCYWLQSIEPQLLAKVTRSATVHRITVDVWKSLRIPLPPLAEQKRIVAILDEAFEAIERAEALRSSALHSATALFPAIASEVFDTLTSDSPRIPLDQLTDLDTPITYGVVKPGPEGSVPFVRGGDVLRGEVLTDQLRTITDEVSTQYRRTLLRGGEILVSLVGQPGEVGIAPDHLRGANIARQVGLIRLRPGIAPEYVAAFLRSPQGQEQLGAREGGSVQQVINLRDLRTVTIPMPDESTRSSIIERVRNAEILQHQLITTLNQRQKRLGELRQSLLSSAFHGELGVVLPESGRRLAGAIA